MDETLWPNVEKTVRGTNAGSPYEVTYTPKKDIDGEYFCDVTYGMMAGLDPNRALVFGLQARGDKLISRDFLRRQMPWEMNVTQEEEKLEVEQLRDALIQAVSGYAQAIPVMAQQGGDPSKVLSQLAAVIAGRQKGDPIEKVIAEAFMPEPQPQVSPEAGAPGAGMSGEPGTPGSAPSGGLSASGLMPGVAPGQQGMAPGGRPALQTLLAGLSSSGQPMLSGAVSRRTPV